jgi:hypothetical protein
MSSSTGMSYGCVCICVCSFTDTALLPVFFDVFLVYLIHDKGMWVVCDSAVDVSSTDIQ